MHLALQNIPSAVVLTLGNKVELYSKLVFVFVFSLSSYPDNVIDVNNSTAVQEGGRQVRRDDQTFSIPLVTAAGPDSRVGQPSSG